MNFTDGNLMPLRSQESANHAPCTGSKSKNTGDHSVTSSAMRANSTSVSRNGMRAWFTNSVESTVRAVLEVKLEKQTSPLQTGGTSVARRAQIGRASCRERG